MHNVVKITPTDPHNYDKRVPPVKLIHFAWKWCNGVKKSLDDSGSFDGLSDEDENDNDGGNKIYALLDAPMVSQADLMVANFGGDDGKDQDKLEDYFKCADLMAGSIGT